MLIRPLRPIEASSFFNHCRVSENVLPWVIKTDFPTPSSLIWLWTSNAIAKHSTSDTCLRHLKGGKPESQSSRNHLFHVEQSSLTSDLGRVQAHGALLASPPPTSRGRAVHTAHSPVSAVAVGLDQAQVQLGVGTRWDEDGCGWVRAVSGIQPA